MIRGEPIPVEKMAGDAVISGTVNGTGSFVMTDFQNVGSLTLTSTVTRWVREFELLRK